LSLLLPQFGATDVLIPIGCSFYLKDGATNEKQLPMALMESVVSWLRTVYTELIIIEARNVLTWQQCVCFF
jgi:hypothetical protein